MRTYRCVDMLNITKSEDIEASSPDAAMRKYFKKYGITEKPVRSAKQTHHRKLDCRFYTKNNHDTYGIEIHKPHQVFIGFNREGFEFYGCTHKEFDESLGRDLTWAECGKL